MGRYGLPDLTHLSALVQLRGLSFHAARAVPSLKPLSKLVALQTLRFHGTATDKSVTPLATLSNLRTLQLNPGSFPLEEFAELAVTLTETDGPHRSPFLIDASSMMEFLGCKRCRGHATVTTLGKPSRTLCQACDVAAITKHVARWEILVSAARARVARTRVTLL